MYLLKGILFGIIAQIFTFLQLQGQLKYEWFKNILWAITAFSRGTFNYLFMTFSSKT
jgi:hypothetical protein